MYVRIARFEGGDADAIDKQVEGIRTQMAEGRERMASGDVPEDIAEVMGAMTRAKMPIRSSISRPVTSTSLQPVFFSVSSAAIVSSCTTPCEASVPS